MKKVIKCQLLLKYMVYWTISAKMMAETYFCPANLDNQIQKKVWNLYEKHYFMVSTAKILLFPGQNYYFPGHSIQDIKVVNQDKCEKGYRIYSIYDQLLKFCGASPPSTHTHFYLNLN